MAVLGALLTDPDVVDDVSLILQPAHMYRDPHRRIYQAILSVHQSGTTADIITVSEALRKEDQLAGVGGTAYLTECMGLVTSAANALYHATIVLEKAMLRAVLETGQQLVREALDGRDEATNILAGAIDQLDQLAGNATRAEVRSVQDMVPVMTEMIDAAHKTNRTVIGIQSGMDCLDTCTMGFQPGRLYVIGAPTGVGKTTLVLNCLHYATMALQQRGLVFSLEMSKPEYIYRLIAIHTAIPHRLIEGGMSDREWQKYTARCEWMQNNRLLIVDDCAVTAEDIVAITRREHRKSGLSLVAVDYAQLIRWAGHPATERHLQVSAQGRTMKRMARQLNIPVILVTQLTDDGRTRESRDLENDSDFYMTLEESDPQHQDSATFPLTGKVRKNRGGPKGELKFQFNKPIQQITDGTAQEEF